MRLSVAIPAYNQGQYLQETIESLLAQTQPPDEIVVSDNHSTDSTPEVLKAYGDRVRIIRPPVHLDAHPHFDFIVSKLHGDWFSLLSSDDVALPCFVESLVEGMQASERAVLIRADYEMMDGQGRSIRAVRMNDVRHITSPPETFYEQLCFPKIGFLAFAARKSAWRQVGGFGNEIFILGDWAFWLRLSPTGDFVHIARIVSRYRWSYRPGIEKSRVLARARDEVRIHESLIPRIARELKTLDEKRIRKASRSRCLALMRSASQLLAAPDCLRVADVLAKWAEGVGLGVPLGRLRAGRQVPKRPGYLGLLRHILKGVRTGRPVSRRTWQ